MGYNNFSFFSVVTNAMAMLLIVKQLAQMVQE